MIFPTGAKAKAKAEHGAPIEDPAVLIEWPTKDRCILTLGGENEIKADSAVFEAIVQDGDRNAETAIRNAGMLIRTSPRHRVTARHSRPLPASYAML